MNAVMRAAKGTGWGSPSGVPVGVSVAATWNVPPPCAVTSAGTSCPFSVTPIADAEVRASPLTAAAKTSDADGVKAAVTMTSPARAGV